MRRSSQRNNNNRPLKIATSSPLVYSDGTRSTSTSLANADWEIFDIPTGAPTTSRRDIMDISRPRGSDLNLNEVKKHDPFLYYSIVGTGDKIPGLPSKRSNATLADRNDDADIRRITSDSLLQVKRKSRISYETHFDFGLMFEKIKELEASSKTSKRKTFPFSDIAEELLGELEASSKTSTRKTSDICEELLADITALS